MLDLYKIYNKFVALLNIFPRIFCIYIQFSRDFAENAIPFNRISNAGWTNIYCFYTILIGPGLRVPIASSPKKTLANNVIISFSFAAQLCHPRVENGIVVAVVLLIKFQVTSTKYG